MSIVEHPTSKMIRLEKARRVVRSGAEYTNGDIADAARTLLSGGPLDYQEGKMVLKALGLPEVPVAEQIASTDVEGNPIEVGDPPMCSTKALVVEHIKLEKEMEQKEKEIRMSMEIGRASCRERVYAPV